MRDERNRTIDYMRVSITDRCNLRCVYCTPSDFACVSHQQVLRYEEILRVCGIAAKLGIRTVKVTGGEPLARKGCVDFIKELKNIPGIRHVTLTTNGVLLEPLIHTLTAIGLDGLNISLDALTPETYLRMAGRHALRQVWQSLQAALEAGLRVKINCVPVRSVNEDEILPISRLAERFPVDVRFIELMPTSQGEALRGIPGDEIIKRLSIEYPDLKPDGSIRGFGPARYYGSAGLKGGIGLIDAVSNHFCSGCNRLRLTSEGFLKLCLYHSDGVDLRGMLRGGASDSEIEAVMRDAAYRKPERHNFGSGNDSEGIGLMSRIGG